MMLYSGLLSSRQSSVNDYSSFSSVQSDEAMASPRSQIDDQDMRNGNGDPSLGLIPTVPRIEEPDEQHLALQPTDPSFPIDTAAQSGARIFIHAPQYHWHTSGTDGIDQEARERLVALEALVDRFGRQTEQREEQLANRMETEGAIRAQGRAEFDEFRST